MTARDEAAGLPGARVVLDCWMSMNPSDLRPAGKHVVR
jgi:hypothetical protein